MKSASSFAVLILLALCTTQSFGFQVPLKDASGTPLSNRSCSFRHSRTAAPTLAHSDGTGMLTLTSDTTAEIACVQAASYLVGNHIAGGKAVVMKSNGAKAWDALVCATCGDASVTNGSQCCTQFGSRCTWASGACGAATN